MLVGLSHGHDAPMTRCACYQIRQIGQGLPAEAEDTSTASIII